MSEETDFNRGASAGPSSGMPNNPPQDRGSQGAGGTTRKPEVFPATVGRSSYSALIGAFIISNLSPWYAGLTKPGFALPSWIFWPVQMMLYALMALSVWMVWETKAARSVKFPAFFVFGIQLLLNIAWPAMFFGAQSPLLGLVVIVILVAAILATVLSFYRINKWSAVMLCPHLIWVCYEMILNISIWWLN